MGKRPEADVLELETPDGLGYAVWHEGRIIGVVTLRVAGDAVSDVWIMLNPGKLRMWNG